MISGKKGQGGGDAAILLVVITLILVLYILIIPPDARQALLNEDQVNNETNDVPNGEPTREILLSESPGELEFISRLERTINLPSFRIQSVTGGEIIAERGSLRARNSAFETQDASMTFSINPELTQNLIFSANVERGVGEITVILNEETTLYQGEITQANLPTIFIDNTDLRRENRITIQVSNPGVAFWRVNQYNLENIRISADVTDVSSAENRQTFDVSQEEIQNFRSANIRFLPTCSSQTNIRGYTIRLNNLPVFEGTPDCETFNQITVDRNQLRQGTNTIEFSLERGEILVDLLEVRTQLEQPENPLLYFTMDDRHFRFDEENDRYVLRDSVHVDLELNFPTPGERRRVEAFVNGQVVGFSTTDSRATQRINNFVRPGTNSLELRPQQRMTISDVRVLRR